MNIITKFFKSISCITVLVLLITAASWSNASEAIDPYIMLGAKHGVGSDKDGDNGIASAVSALIQTRDPETVIKTAKSAGGRARLVNDGIVSVTMPLAQLKRLADEGMIVYAEADKPLRMMLDQSLSAISAPTVHNGDVDGVAYDGAGVIIGIIDSGIDWRHPVFLDSMGNSRILSIWDQTIESAQGFSPPSEIADAVGIECLRKDIEERTCPSKDDMGHGTHVAGIAAGNDDTYGGVAPGAELVVVKVLGSNNPFSTSVIDAADYIFRKAQEAGKPAVINISLGSHFGAHDDTSLFEQALDSMVTAASGRAIVAGAGNNDHQDYSVVASIHASTELQQDECRFEFMGWSPNLHWMMIDVWQRLDAALDFGIGVDEYGAYEETGLVTAGDSKDISLDGGRLRVIIDSTETSNPENGKKHTIVYIGAAEGDAGQDISIGNYTFDLIASGSGSFDAWIINSGVAFTKREGSYLSGGKRYCPGDSRRTVGLPATAADVLAIGSFVSRDDLDSLHREFGGDIEFTTRLDISPFSSRGPSADPSRTGQKPEITAPGEWIISALSEDAINSLVESGWAVDYAREFAALKGTSMASPHAAGAIALMFQRRPDLNASQIKMLLARNAMTDMWTGSVPNNRWGYGKLNLLNIFMNFDSTDLTTPLPVSDEEIGELPFLPQPYADLSTNEESSGGCTLNPETGPVSTAPIVLLLLALAAPVIARRRTIRAVFGLLLALCCLASSCGGSSTPAAAGFNFDQTTLTQNQYLKIDATRMMAYLDQWNDEETVAMRLAIPLRHYFKGETIELGADNVYSSNQDQASLLIVRYAKTDETTTQSEDDSSLAAEAWASTAGQLTLDEAEVSFNGTLAISISGALLRPIDIASDMIDREGDAVTFSITANAAVSEGYITGPFIVDANPLTGNIGTKVLIRGFNFTDSDYMVFSGCSTDALPTIVNSPNDAEVTISAYCPDGRLDFNENIGYRNGRQPSFVFDPSLEMTTRELPHPESDLLKTIFDPSTDLIYMLFKPGNDIEVYSINDREFIDPRPLPVSADTFDIASDNSLLTGKDKILTVVTSDGTVQGHVSMPKGDYISDIVIGPAQTALILVSYLSGSTPPAICRFDRLAMTASCPTELALYSYFYDASVFVTRPDRKIAVVVDGEGYGSRAAVFTFDDVGNITKTSDEHVSYRTASVHPLRDEIWLDNDIYLFDLTESRTLAVSSSFPSPGGERYYSLDYFNVQIRADDSDQDVLSYTSFENGANEYYTSSSGNIIITNGDRYLLSIFDESIRQLDLSRINSYLDGE